MQPTPIEEDLRDVAESTEPERLRSEVLVSASDYFLAGEPVRSEPTSVDINVAPHGKPKHWVRFRLAPVGRDMIKEIRKDSTNAQGEEDDMLVNLRLAIQGMVDPDLSREDMRGGFVDPADTMQKMLGHKGGLIDKLGQQVLTISGYDVDDMREVNAAGN